MLFSPCRQRMSKHKCVLVPMLISHVPNSFACSQLLVRTFIFSLFLFYFNFSLYFYGRRFAFAYSWTGQQILLSISSSTNARSFNVNDRWKFIPSLISTCLTYILTRWIVWSICILPTKNMFGSWLKWVGSKWF